MTGNNKSPLGSTRVQDASTRFFISNSAPLYAADLPKELPPNDSSNQYLWYPMYVKYRKELSVKAVLDDHDFRTFVPMETYHVKRGASVRTEERPAIHNLLFVYSFKERISWMKMFNADCEPLQYMSRHFLDGSSEIITVTQKAMENIIKAASIDDPNGQRTYTDRPLQFTDLDRRILFIGGAFKGVEGIIKRVDGNRAMVIPLAQGINMKITITHATDIEFL